MAVHERTPFSRDAFRRVVSKLSVLYTKGIVSTYRLLDPKNTLLFLAFWRPSEVTSAAPSQGQGQSQRTVTTPGDLFIKMHAAKQALTEADKTTEVSFLSSLPILPLEKPSVEYSVDKPRVAYSVDKPSVAYTIPSPRDSGGVV